MTASITLHHMTPFDHTAEIIIINVLRPWGHEAGQTDAKARRAVQYHVTLVYKQTQKQQQQQ